MLSRYGRLGSSSRLRFYQYFDYLKTHGLKITTMPLFSDSYIKNLYAGQRKSPVEIITSYGRRLACLMNTRHFDLVWLEAEMLPFLPAWGEYLISRSKTPLVVDYDDAVFHRYGQNQNAMVRIFLGNKIEKIMKHADLVIAGNDYLIQHAINSGAKRVEYLPTVIDLSHYPLVTSDRNHPFTIGWMGSPVTQKYLSIAGTALAEICRDRKCRLLLVGSSGSVLAGLNLETRKWSEHTEASDIASFDVGIMPLPDKPWERGKCGYKLIQYMAGSIPVVASPVGVNNTIVEHGDNGFLAANKSEWLDAFHALADDQALRDRMGKAGRHKVENEYCLEIAAPRLESVLKSLC